VERHGEENLVKPRIKRVEVAVLLLVHHHETVMLFENVIVAPKLGRELEPVTQAEQDQNGSDGEEEREASPQPASAPLALLGVEVRARDRGKAVSLVEDNRPDGHQQKQRRMREAPERPECIGYGSSAVRKPEQVRA